MRALAAVALAVLALGAAGLSQPDRATAGPLEEGRYIVWFHDWVEDPRGLAIEQTERYSAQLGFVYEIFKGYSVSGLSPSAAEAIRAEPTVLSISLDQIVCPAVEDVPCPPEEEKETPTGPPASSGSGAPVPVASQAASDAPDGRPHSKNRKRCRAKRGAARLSRQRPLRRCRASRGGSRRSTGIRPPL